MTASAKVASYQSYRGLSTLAGLATIAEAARPGLSVEACVARHKRYHYAFFRLHEILTARITAEPIYELKTGFSHHSYLCAEHVQALRNRVAEMREPPLGLDAVPEPALGIFFDEILAAPRTAELLVGVYEKALPALDAALAKHIADTNPLTDAPSVRIIRFARLELADMIAFGKQCIGSLVDDKQRAAMREWLSLLDECLAAAGGVDGVAAVSGKAGKRLHSAKEYKYDPVPKRDERFQDLYNQGVNAESFIYNPDFPPQPKTLMMLYKRIREIDVPEMMASIIYQTKGKPWGYYRAMSRQLWDEARHAMMGEVGFVALGVDWTQARITHNWSLRLNTECTPIERHAVLYFIEQGLMTRTGKRYEWEVGVESGIPIMATIQDYDWADEVLHAALGREWYIPEIGDWKQALDYGDQCWAKILSNWRTVRDQGLTQHENWWPGIYQQACQSWGVQPDPKILGFNETYEDVRADLKKVLGSA
ncbi:hypothetical protein AYO44_07985 [Planctomycetaceae bacterium SCGC AG-212-F19]|nr:hypothetical protein AYO44_07985 [Planctomycetaceae bacterium SCGC AG-212-F19]